MPEPTPQLSVLIVLAQSTGGIGRHVKTLASGLPERGVSVRICAPQESVEALGLRETGVPIVIAPLGGNGVRALRATRAALRAATRGVDLVHAHGLRAGADCAAFAGGTPLVVTLHNAALRGRVWKLTHGALSRYVARAADLTLAASDDLADQARAAGARDVRSIFVAAPTLAPPVRTAAQVRSGLGIGDRPIVLAIGRLQHQKRLDVLVAAAAGWSSVDGPIVLIAGDGPEFDALQAQIAETGAPVRLLGARSDVPDLLSAATVLALPSEWEARALVVQEAMLAGVPVVCTPVGGLPSLVGDAATIVPVGDGDALRSALEAIVSDPVRRQRAAELSRSQAATWPTEATSLDVLVEAYLDLVYRVRLR